MDRLTARLENKSIRVEGKTSCQRRGAIRYTSRLLRSYGRHLISVLLRRFASQVSLRSKRFLRFIFGRGASKALGRSDRRLRMPLHFSLSVFSVSGFHSKGASIVADCLCGGVCRFGGGVGDVFLADQGGV